MKIFLIVLNLLFLIVGIRSIIANAHIIQLWFIVVAFFSLLHVIFGKMRTIVRAFNLSIIVIFIIVIIFIILSPTGILPTIPIILLLISIFIAYPIINIKCFDKINNRSKKVTLSNTEKDAVKKSNKKVKTIEKHIEQTTKSSGDEQKPKADIITTKDKKEWYVYKNEQQLEELFSISEITKMDEYPNELYVWKEGMNEWQSPINLDDFSDELKDANKTEVEPENVIHKNIQLGIEERDIWTVNPSRLADKKNNIAELLSFLPDLNSDDLKAWKAKCNPAFGLNSFNSNIAAAEFIINDLADGADKIKRFVKHVKKISISCSFLKGNWYPRLCITLFRHFKSGNIDGVPINVVKNSNGKFIVSSPKN